MEIACAATDGAGQCRKGNRCAGFYYPVRMPAVGAFLPFTPFPRVVKVTIGVNGGRLQLRSGADRAARYVIMDLIQNVADYNDAPSFIATNVCRLFLVSPNIVRVTFVRADRRFDGTEEQRVSGHVDMDIAQMICMNALIRDALPRLLADASGVTEAKHPRPIATH